MKKWMARLALTLGLMCLGLGIMLSGFEWATAPAMAQRQTCLSRAKSARTSTI